MTNRSPSRKLGPQPADAIKGVLGGLLAIGLDYAAYLAVSRSLFTATFFSAGQMLLFLLIGTVLGFVASATSVNRHLPPL